VFNLPQALIGASTLAPLGPGALIEASAVVGRGGETGTREVSLELDRARAVAGTLKSGEYVDVLGTFGTGADAYTTVMVGHLQVVSITNVSSSLGDSRGQLITFAALTETDAEAIADAAVAAQVTLVRSAETGPGNPAPTPASPSYRAPGPPARTGN
jgi:Flp pilus assembly protein CpaB